MAASPEAVLADATKPVTAASEAGRLKTIQLLPVILVPLDRPGQTFLETDSG